jgi:hypothetical protein
MRPTRRKETWIAALLGLLLVGCGTTKSQQATQQLLISNAVDLSISQMDFGILSGRSVYLDARYLVEAEAQGFGNAPYIISSFRQQMLFSGCQLRESAETADYIMEIRIGTLGTDNHDITYGLPASSVLSSAATLVTNAPTIPTLPEISLARKSDQRGIAKIAAFVYDRKLGTRVWQSGIQLARSNSSDFWILGAGPFQSGTIHDGTQFAGQQIDLPFIGKNQAELAFEQEKLIRQYEDHATFLKPTDDSKDESPADVVPAENEDVPAADEGSTEEPGNLPPAVEKATPIQQ